MFSKPRLVVGISGGSGAVLGIRLLQALRALNVESHLIVTPSARLTIQQETDWSIADVLALADRHYNTADLAAPIASGSFATQGMVVIPCSIKSLSAIANSYSGDLLTRAADVTLKEGRALLLVVREAPLHAGHIRLMELAAQAGAILFPPVPAFYTRPQTVDDIVENIVGRVLRRMGLENPLYQEWQGLERKPAPTEDAAPPVGAQTVWDLPAMTIATVGADGTPHAATVYFAADGNYQQLFFFSASDSQHSQDLQANPQAAVTIHPSAATWQAIRGLQMRGTVRAIPSGEAWEAAWVYYQRKFPFVTELKEQVARTTLYAFTPQWVRWINNQERFGHKEEWTQA